MAVHANKYGADPREVELVDRCLAGDIGAEQQLFRRQLPRVTATLYRLLGPSHDLEDLVQETFLQVFRSLPSFRNEAKLSTWINRITVHVAMRYLRRKPPTSIPLELVPGGTDAALGADRVMIAREGVRRLYAELARLPAKSRVAFALHVIEGRKMSEVARLMDSSVGATRVRIFRARRRLEREAARDVILSAYLTSAGKGKGDP